MSQVIPLRSFTVPYIRGNPSPLEFTIPIDKIPPADSQSADLRPSALLGKFLIAAHLRTRLVDQDIYASAETCQWS